MKRMNLGAGSILPATWDNVDIEERPGLAFVWDVRHPCPYEPQPGYDYIVANHMFSDVGHNDLVAALSNVRSMLAEGGVLRILVPDVFAAFRAWIRGDESWFPQDARTGDLDAKFCTFLTWFGDSRSVFTWGYLVALLHQAGFSDVSLDLKCGETTFGPPEIVELDDRCTEALIVEALK